MVTLDSDLPSWESVRASHTFQTLITGNGMSINIWPRFGYSSLYDKAGLSADQGLGKVVSQQVSRHAMAWSGCLA